MGLVSPPRPFDHVNASSVIWLFSAFGNDFATSLGDMLSALRRNTILDQHSWPNPPGMDQTLANRAALLILWPHRSRHAFDQ
jgi:hypothetical protein